jgi:hypothetical protein
MALSVGGSVVGELSEQCGERAVGHGHRWLAGSRVHWGLTAWHGRAALSPGSVKSLGLLSGDASGQVLYEGYGQVQA